MFEIVTAHLKLMLRHSLRNYEARYESHFEMDLVHCVGCMCMVKLMTLSLASAAICVQCKLANSSLVNDGNHCKHYI